MYVDIVTISDQNGYTCLRTAPFMAHLKIGDMVAYQNERAYESIGKIVDIATFDTDKEEYRTLVGFVRDTTLRVTKKILFQELEEGEENG